MPVATYQYVVRRPDLRAYLAFERDTLAATPEQSHHIYEVYWSEHNRQVVTSVDGRVYALDCPHASDALDEVTRLDRYLQKPNQAWEPQLQSDLGVARNPFSFLHDPYARFVNNSLNSLNSVIENHVEWEVAPRPVDPAPIRTATQAPRPIIRGNKLRHYLTLIPYSSFRKTAACLHDEDLKLMRVCALRVFYYLDKYPRIPNSRTTKKACELWRGFENALCQYGIAIARELRTRGFEDTSLEVFKSKATRGPCIKPEWVYWTSLQESHRSVLIVRDFKKRLAKECHAILKQLTEKIGLREFIRETTHFNTGLSNVKRYDLPLLFSSLQYSYNLDSDMITPSHNLYGIQENWDCDMSIPIVYPGDFASCH